MSFSVNGVIILTFLWLSKAVLEVSLSLIFCDKVICGTLLLNVLTILICPFTKHV